MGKYYISQYCQVLEKGEQSIICHCGNGLYIKMPSICWKTIEKYIGDYSIDDICEAAADEEDKKYFQQLFEALINRGILVKDNAKIYKAIDIIITNRCNLKCIHCCADAQGVAGCDKLSTEDIFRIIDKVVKMNPKSIVLNGGEPMLRKDFFVIAKYLKENYSGHIGLMTNGTLISEKNIDELVTYFETYDISLDGYDEETCSKIRGKGIFDRVMYSIKLLINRGVNPSKIALSMVETLYTQGKTDKFLELNKELGTSPVLRDFSPLGRGKTNQESLELKEDIDELILHSFKEDKHCKEEKHLMCQNCLAGTGKLAINHEGDIFPCALLESAKYCFGNALEIDDLAEYFISDKYKESLGYKNFKKIVPMHREGCKECNVRAFCVYCLADFEMHLDSEYFGKVCEMKKVSLQHIWE